MYNHLIDMCAYNEYWCARSMTTYRAQPEIQTGIFATQTYIPNLFKF